VCVQPSVHPSINAVVVLGIARVGLTLLTRLIWRQDNVYFEFNHQLSADPLLHIDLAVSDADAASECPGRTKGD
jgi:hypothetical protein